MLDAMALSEKKGPTDFLWVFYTKVPRFWWKSSIWILLKPHCFLHIMGISVVGPSRKGWHKGVQRRSCEFLFCFILTLKLKLLHCRSSLKFLSGLLHQGDPGKPGEPGPSGEPGIPVCIWLAFPGRAVPQGCSLSFIQKHEQCGISTQNTSDLSAPCPCSSAGWDWRPRREGDTGAQRSRSKSMLAL